MLGQSLERAKAEYHRYTAGGRKEPPVIDILIISGGGDSGALGTAFLKGWQKVPAQHPLAKPEFDAVTGVSTGTLIAPFAFLGVKGLKNVNRDCCCFGGSEGSNAKESFKTFAIG